jgi:chromosomal replication initiation ATPase DnaA
MNQLDTTVERVFLMATRARADGFEKLALSLDLIDELVLAGERTKAQTKVAALYDIMDAARNEFSVSRADIRSGMRKKKVVTARAMFFYLARERTRSSWPEIAAVVGRDHTTAMASHKRVATKLASGDPLTRWNIAQVDRRLGA